jgi:hypothetical protein
MRSGARREVEQGLMRSCAIFNFDTYLEWAAFGEILMLTAYLNNTNSDRTAKRTQHFTITKIG